jgi:acyl-CoA thioesterase
MSGTKKNNIDPDKFAYLKDLLNSSPYYKHIKMELTGFTENGCLMKMEVGKEHANIYGNVHGGAIASLADSACGLSLIIRLHEGEFAVTQTLVVNYLKPVPIGTMTAKGWIVHRGKTTAMLEAHLYSESGDLVAHAQTTHAIRRRKSGGLINL